MSTFPDPATPEEQAILEAMNEKHKAVVKAGFTPAAWVMPYEMLLGTTSMFGTDVVRALVDGPMLALPVDPVD